MRRIDYVRFSKVSTNIPVAIFMTSVYTDTAMGNGWAVKPWLDESESWALPKFRQRNRKDINDEKFGSGMSRPLSRRTIDKLSTENIQDILNTSQRSCWKMNRRLTQDNMTECWHFYYTWGFAYKRSTQPESGIILLPIHHAYTYIFSRNTSG
jgi:hypothetical protein